MREIKLLILTRKIGESLIIGDNIRITVLEIRGKQVRLGIEAPPDIAVMREELSQNMNPGPTRGSGVRPH